jgi:hypothetical protein
LKPTHNKVDFRKIVFCKSTNITEITEILTRNLIFSTLRNHFRKLEL